MNTWLPIKTYTGIYLRGWDLRLRWLFCSALVSFYSV